MKPHIRQFTPTIQISQTGFLITFTGYHTTVYRILGHFDLRKHNILYNDQNKTIYKYI